MVEDILNWIYSDKVQEAVDKVSDALNLHKKEIDDLLKFLEEGEDECITK